MIKINEMIDSYQQSIGEVHRRIRELNREIFASGGEGHPKTKMLAKRRYLLYSQMWDMQSAVDSLTKYVDAVEKRNKREDMLS